MSRGRARAGTGTSASYAGPAMQTGGEVNRGEEMERKGRARTRTKWALGQRQVGPAPPVEAFSSV